MDKILSDAGRGLSDFLNGLIEKAGSLVDAGIGKIADVTGSTVAGVSGAISEGVGSIANSFTVNGPSMGSQPDPVKLGGNARKQEMLATIQPDTSQFAASLEHLDHGIHAIGNQMRQNAGVAM